MPNDIKSWIVNLKNGEDIRVKAEMPVADGLNAIKFMTQSDVVARFENSEMRFYHVEGPDVERNANSGNEKPKQTTRSRSKSS